MHVGRGWEREVALCNLPGKRNYSSKSPRVRENSRREKGGQKDPCVTGIAPQESTVIRGHINGSELVCLN
jgi:hypothetical protein